MSFGLELQDMSVLTSHEDEDEGFSQAPLGLLCRGKGAKSIRPENDDDRTCLCLCLCAPNCMNSRGTEDFV